MAEVSSVLKKESYLDEILAPRHGGRVEEISEERGINPGDLIDFSANMNPLAPPGSLEELIDEAISSLKHYPDDRYGDFRESVVDFLAEGGGNLPSPESVIPGNGSVEIFRLFLRFVASIGAGSVLVPYPTFSEYALQSRLFGLEVDRKEYGEVLGLDKIELDNYDLVFLCNPNNPTGTLRSAEVLCRFVSRCDDAGTYVMLDEAFIELSRPEESLVSSIQNFSNLVVVRSLTKEFSIPGLRIGYGVFSKELARRVEKLRPPWNLNCFAAFAGSSFLDEERKLLSESRDYLARERNFLAEELDGLGFSLYPSDVNYLLLDAEPVGWEAGELVDRCLDHNVLLRNADSFYGLNEYHVRVAVKKREANRELVRALDLAID